MGNDVHNTHNQPPPNHKRRDRDLYQPTAPRLTVTKPTSPSFSLSPHQHPHPLRTNATLPSSIHPTHLPNPSPLRSPLPTTTINQPKPNGLPHRRRNPPHLHLHQIRPEQTRREEALPRRRPRRPTQTMGGGGRGGESGG